MAFNYASISLGKIFMGLSRLMPSLSSLRVDYCLPAVLAIAALTPLALKEGVKILAPDRGVVQIADDVSTENAYQKQIAIKVEVWDSFANIPTSERTEFEDFLKSTGLANPLNETKEKFAVTEADLALAGSLGHILSDSGLRLPYTALKKLQVTDKAIRQNPKGFTDYLKIEPDEVAIKNLKRLGQYAPEKTFKTLVMNDVNFQQLGTTGILRPLVDKLYSGEMDSKDFSHYYYWVNHYEGLRNQNLLTALHKDPKK